jgi:imidazolonepropionase-like amidohydrolase
VSGTDSDTDAVLVCGEHFDGHSDGLGGPVEILVQGGVIREIGPQVRRPGGARVVNLGGHTVTPGFIDCHVHLTMNAANLASQLLDSAATKALTGLHIARQYMERGFTTLRDLGSADPAWPTVDLRNALDAGLVAGPRLIVAAHLIGSTGSHADVTSLYPPRWQLPVSDPADGPVAIRERVRREHKYGSDWIKTTNAGGYFSPGDDPARVTWFDEEMQAVCDTAAQLGMPVAVHTGAAQACKQAIRCGARSLEHAYLIDEDGLELAEQAGVYVVPTMQMTREDLDELDRGALPAYTAAKFRRDAEEIQQAQHRIAASGVKIAYGTDSGMFPFSHGNLEFQAMVAAGLSPARALRAATGTAAELLGRSDIGRLEPGRAADIVAMPGNPLADISVTASVDFVMRAGRLDRLPAAPGQKPVRRSG